MIHPADKGEGIVILDKINYEKEMYRILNEPNPYKELPNNPTLSYKRKLQDIITKGYVCNILNRILLIYYLPRIHKDPLHPPGWPIVSGIDFTYRSLHRFLFATFSETDIILS